MTSNGKISKTSVPRSHADKNLLVDVDHVGVTIGRETVLDSLSFCIHSGEFVGLIGPNGAGKTTLLQVLLGLRQPTAGTVKRVERPIGYTPQRGQVYGGLVPMSVFEVVRLGATSNEAAHAALEKVGMSTALHRRFGELSGGQQQRVVIAKALAGNAALLVLDEPATGIDEQSQAAFYALLQDLQKQGMTIIMVSHDIDMVISLATRVLCLNQRMLYDGAPEHFEADTHMPAYYNARHQRLHHHHEGGTHA